MELKNLKTKELIDIYNTIIDYLKYLETLEKSGSDA